MRFHVFKAFGKGENQVFECDEDTMLTLELTEEERKIIAREKGERLFTQHFAGGNIGLLMRELYRGGIKLKDE